MRRCRATPGDYIHDGGLCGKRLGAKAHLYGSGPASDDFVDVMNALGIRKVDLYGDSYGTFLAQTFAVRHPTRVRSVVLDAAYPVEGLDPLYPEYGPALRRALQLICQRSPACQASGIDPIGTLVALSHRCPGERAHRVGAGSATACCGA